MRPNPPWVWMKNIKSKQVQFLEMCNVWCAMLTLRYIWETNLPKALDSTVEVDKIKGNGSSRQCQNFFWKYLYGHITDTLPRDIWKLSGRGGGGGCEICWVQKHFDKAPSRFTKALYPNKSAFTEQSLGSKVEKSIFLLINWLLLQSFSCYFLWSFLLY